MATSVDTFFQLVSRCCVRYPVKSKRLTTEENTKNTSRLASEFMWKQCWTKVSWREKGETFAWPTSKGKVSLLGPRGTGIKREVIPGATCAGLTDQCSVLLVVTSKTPKNTSACLVGTRQNRTVFLCQDSTEIKDCPCRARPSWNLLFNTTYTAYTSVANNKRTENNTFFRFFYEKQNSLQLWKYSSHSNQFSGWILWVLLHNGEEFCLNCAGVCNKPNWMTRVPGFYHNSFRIAVVFRNTTTPVESMSWGFTSQSCKCWPKSSKFYSTH